MDNEILQYGQHTIIEFFTYIAPIYLVAMILTGLLILPWEKNLSTKKEILYMLLSGLFWCVVMMWYDFTIFSTKYGILSIILTTLFSTVLVKFRTKISNRKKK